MASPVTAAKVKTIMTTVIDNAYRIAARSLALVSLVSNQ